jgi:hypothetical protein
MGGNTSLPVAGGVSLFYKIIPGFRMFVDPPQKPRFEIQNSLSYQIPQVDGTFRSSTC